MCLFRNTLLLFKMTYIADTYRTVVGAQRREAEESSPWHKKKNTMMGALQLHGGL